MKKTATFLTITALTAFLAYQSHAAMSFPVNSRQNTPVYSDVLQLGVHYTITVSGWVWYSYHPDTNPQDWRARDANFQFYDSSTFPQSGPVLNTTPVLAPLEMDSASPVWLGSTDGLTYAAHTYSPDHIYKLSFLGDGQAHSFQLVDSFYADNVGSVMVSIAPVPEPSTFIAAGLLLLPLGTGVVRKFKKR